MGGIGEQEDNNRTENGGEYVNYHLTCYQADCINRLKAKGQYMYWVLLLDTASTVEQVCIPNLLTDIKTIEKGIYVPYNTRKTENKTVGCLGSLDMWLHTKGIANVVSMKSLMEKYHVTFDSREGNVSLLVQTTRNIGVLTPQEWSILLDIS